MVECPSCIKGSLTRTRRGILGRIVTVVSGRYPWRCAHCSKRFLIRDSGPAKRRTKSKPGQSPASGKPASIA
jgi:transposase-like protein